MASIEALQKYIDRQNAWRKMFPTIANILKMPTTTAEADAVIEELETDLAPENLSCDGEITGQEWRDKSKRLNDAYNEAVNLRSAFQTIKDET